ncbi:MAG TPA: DNA repair protein RecO [Flavobacterium sp.]|nr:DNA repair protein RecO [Flavobacterium sp.]
MQVKTQAIVLSALRYQEKSLIVKCLTKDFGLKTYFVRNAFSKQQKGLNSAYFQPLNQLFIEAVHKNKGTMEYFTELKLMHPYKTISQDFYKTSVSVFLAEFLSNCIKEEQANSELYLFLETSLIWFDTHEFTADFHLWFLLNVTKYLGFYPDDSEMDALYFNPKEGSFSNEYSFECFNIEESALFRKLLQIPFSSKESVLKNEERRGLLKLLVRYYETHIAHFKPIKSLEILPELFQ